MGKKRKEYLFPLRMIAFKKGGQSPQAHTHKKIVSYLQGGIVERLCRLVKL